MDTGAAMISDRYQKLLRQTFLDYQHHDTFFDNPLIVERAKGLHYWDVEGRRYFDAIAGVYAATLGHGHPRVIEAIRLQLEKLSFAPPMHGTADVTLEFVDRISAVTPGTLNFVKSFGGGSESVEAALKFARQYFRQTDRPGKFKFISRYHGYHGATFGAMAASGTGPRKSAFEPGPTGFLKVFAPNHYRDDFSDWEQCNRFAARQFEDVIVHEDPSTVAGVILEPVSNTGGVITPTQEYFQILREICDRYDVLLIFDEIITGWGRTGEMFAAQTYDVIPDMICSGKGLSSGTMPLGAMMARRDMAECFQQADKDNFAHGHTYAGHPVGCAAGIAVVEQIIEDRLDKRAGELGERLAARLEKLKRHGVVREVRGKGLLRGVELVRDTESNEPFPELGLALKKTALANGLLLRVDPSWFAVGPALIIDEAGIDEMCDLIDRSLVDALATVRG
ncbi:MAG: aspartate aminotransferase family protein [Gemmatimonadetes bacterium]|jgi:adenosylmethionine-8-amino-7-oxononanoate aminotransferase|nr:aspartate aminotransferase family protein [Gemmatimonadota bacterium]MBT5146219.1 aspartate aminotransferase family protein [Gemmatimonadota bacterium]MBT5587577.1 aspartate aminotransferase family protein [Gemmatimonadota bacterium]MBT5965244.1 aspartate aminotransferase family protein [Gemmatimonadota bacterium]MBT6628678.1 aspartate aminotransferase family protein [Gemmatimonadota bacterium]